MVSTGQNVWFDLMTTDFEGAKRFYSEIAYRKRRATRDNPTEGAA